MDSCFFSLSGLLTAWANGEEKPSRDGHTGKLKCPFCPQKFPSVMYLDMHVKSTHTNLEYELQCPDCAYGTFRKSNYQRHRKDTHDDPPSGDVRPPSRQATAGSSTATASASSGGDDLRSRSPPTPATAGSSTATASASSGGDDLPGKSFYFLLCYFSFWFLPFLCIHIFHDC